MKKMFSLMSIMLAIVLCFVTLSTCVADEVVCEHSWKIGKAATCIDNGNRICTVCGTVEAISATGHTWKNGKTATCTDNGTRLCLTCGVVESISAFGHTWKNGKTATCTEDGNRLCKTCGAVEIIPATGHTEEIIPGKAATCTQAGLTDGTTCSVCSTTLVEQKEIPATGHAEEIIPGKVATCTQTGLTEGKTCSVCGTILVEQKEIPATGHTEEIIHGKAATCTKTGLTDGTTCSVCGTTLVEQQEIPATGHTYNTVTHAPTTSSRGYQEHVCKICGYTYRDHFMPKVGSEKTVPVSTVAPASSDRETLNYGNIVYDINDNNITYQTELEGGEIIEGEQGEKLLTIITMPDEDGTYSLRKLYITFDLLDTFRGEEIDSISLVIEGTELVIPISLFDDEALGFILDDNQNKASGYVFILNPFAEDENGNAGCQVAVYIRTSEGDTEITNVLGGMILNYNGSEFAVDGSTIYQD